MGYRHYFFVLRFNYRLRFMARERVRTEHETSHGFRQKLLNQIETLAQQYSRLEFQVSRPQLQETRPVVGG